MSKSRIIAIAGPGSNSGKTGLACELIRHFSKSRPVGAVKVATSTPDHRCARTNLPCDCLRFDGKMRLITDPAYINKTGKDTAAMFAAGAEPTWWLQTTSDVSEDSARFLYERIQEEQSPKLWIVEGSGLIRTSQADIKIVVAKDKFHEPKTSWHELLPKADLLALSGESLEVDEREFEVPENTPRALFSGPTGEASEPLLTLIKARLG